ncbi:MAG: hypothetical protein CK428_32540, partial [Mycobacterium sp.]
SLEESRDDPLLAGYDTPVLTSRPDSYTTFVDATGVGTATANFPMAVAEDFIDFLTHPSLSGLTGLPVPV